jgi:hypothetical protein
LLWLFVFASLLPKAGVHLFGAMPYPSGSASSTFERARTA